MDGLWRIFHAPALIETTAAGAGRGAAGVAGEEPLQAARPEAINPALISLIICVIRPVATLASDYRHGEQDVVAGDHG
jgi:hypothetical protein